MAGHIQVIGYIWWPNDMPCAYAYSVDGYDIENMRGDDGKIARKDIQAWLDTHAGDFSQLLDFSAVIDSAAYGWSNPDSEMTYFDCMDECSATVEA